MNHGELCDYGSSLLSPAKSTVENDPEMVGLKTISSFLYYDFIQLNLYSMTQIINNPVNNEKIGINNHGDNETFKIVNEVPGKH